MPKLQYPTTIAQAMTAANYRKAPPETRLAFMLGYLCGAMTDSLVARRGPKAQIKWSEARSKEVDNLCLEFDEALLQDMILKITAIKNAKN